MFYRKAPGQGEFSARFKRTSMVLANGWYVPFPSWDRHNSTENRIYYSLRNDNTHVFYVPTN